ncbi:peptide chain release factor N(5)-glutamine methyltransferase [Paraflavitalea soli]|uniref:peptide chain release factor N(5)-glutamine methyltransferase n=1 Tax=Paraflavitalea soli TaxID=2315862 RepID=A0A3B7MU71_9BACT|nr:peptide chain release factor N(5)-glutamine methyltransferase [Paraflavitalea soli]AXY78072.1 peptide chain release factor N(5)-glutamine methyltransferase [Paraflavitalea soli]
MTIQEGQQDLTRQLGTAYEPREAAQIADWVMENLSGLKKIDRLLHKQKRLTPEQDKLLEKYKAQLLEHTPVQYVLHEAWFYGLKLYVDEQVLIPRPETEELVEWVVAEVDNRQSAIGSRQLVILDIGTGSGCIPIALKKKLPGATVYGCDVSKGALGVSRQNARNLAAAVEFLLVDFLQVDQWAVLPMADIIVSNPPYIPVKDKATMHANVLEHEPHLALFVENDDPLLFYRNIARFAQGKLLPAGRIYVEIHEDLGAATVQVFQEHGFAVVLKKDMQGKDRMIRAMKIN